jgi:hypothetical protein
MKIDWGTVISVLIAMVIFKMADRYFLEPTVTSLEESFSGDE